MTREEILDKFTTPPKPVPLDTVELGRVYLLPWNGNQLNEWDKFLQDLPDRTLAEPDANGKAVRVLADPGALLRAAAQMSLCDEHGKLTFQPGDQVLLLRFPAALLKTIYEAVRRLNKLDQRAVEADLDFFPGTRPRGSGTGSPGSLVNQTSDVSKPA
jgi:hypothetical protein